MPKYQSKPGVEIEALLWPGFTADPWPDEQTLFFRPWHPFQIIRASYASGAYTTELRAHGTWCDLPDGHFIVKSKALDEDGRPQFFPSDPDTFKAQWAPV
jgi:hypothetical protein